MFFHTLKTRIRTVVTIENSVPGLTEVAKKHIFDKFYRADSSHKQEGNGLALPAIEKGEIRVENLPEDGCSFTVILKEK